MRKSMMALAAAAAMAVTAVGSTAPAQAHDGFGAGIAAGLIGGALIGGALSSPYYGPGGYYYGGGYGYGPRYYSYGPRYYGYAPAPAYVVSPGYYGGCYWQRQRFWDGYGWRIRRIRVCD
ncbi:hypothetical protein KQX63_18390 [Rhodopseudomonas palustris]|jgi:hypothetical protein|uniref:Uncharacterized protein n=1 Tax=Rhodopseudomonas palustris TaxID=1076 RepID=A0AAX3DUZ0_RHOPL|nr:MULTISPECIES: hypothetical protein [Rhodopseudomonas]AVT82513.1 hypothetical protein RPYSC3_36530 [Rhodopseudomonas palustris]NEV79387.1 hypothetical protein [Rhodopseudomonas sp. BR0C11]NEW98499.1 hypothetical protein [Rhodopseudomonas sp. BR0G17]UYO38615.1 hypothetical protein KQX62_18115 [Rhodopseudomonas palustris]UYO43335.1 hypothetical protein KQX63_18390 [Rhodopseudomonas palustris]